MIIFNKIEKELFQWPQIKCFNKGKIEFYNKKNHLVKYSI